MKNEPIRHGLWLIFAFVISAVAPARSFGDESSTRRIATGAVEIVNLPAPVGTVIVGDPTVVATTLIDTDTIALTGKGHGRTQIVLLDDAGSELGDWSVIVGATDVIVYRGAEMQRMDCARTCVPLETASDASPVPGPGQ